MAFSHLYSTHERVQLRLPSLVELESRAVLGRLRVITLLLVSEGCGRFVVRTSFGQCGRLTFFGGVYPFF